MSNEMTASNRDKEMAICKRVNVLEDNMLRECWVMGKVGRRGVL